MKELTLVAALGVNRVIGQGNALPWNVPSEYHHFLQLIEGHIMLMGRVSFEIFGADLVSSHNLVLSRRYLDLPGAVVCSSLHLALDRAQSLPGRLFCGGGRQVYEQTIGLAHCMLLSYIHGDYVGDTYFPVFGAEWTEKSSIAHPDFDFVTLRRRSLIKT